MMQFISNSRKIPIPKGINAWRARGKKKYEGQTNECFIVMEFVEGKLLKDIWSDMNATSRRYVYQQLAGYIRELRTIQCKTLGPIGREGP
jgi:aminoglycoside phosphotransferase (APT) family kinase protein